MDKQQECIDKVSKDVLNTSRIWNVSLNVGIYQPTQKLLSQLVTDNLRYNGRSEF